MSEGHYSVIRCIPDPARGETFNIGLVVWRKGEYRAAIDPAAAKRAAKENPLLARGALVGLQASVHSQMDKLGRINVTNFERMRRNHSGIPYVFSEPMFVDIQETKFRDLEDTLNRLMERLVRPRHSPKSATEVDPLAELANILWGLIVSRRVEKDHPFEGKKTGKERRVSFYANHGANTVLDVLSLTHKGDETIDQRADAEAFKIIDVTDELKISIPFYVFCALSTTGDKQIANERALQSVRSVGGKIVTDVREAASIMQAAATGSQA